MRRTATTVVLAAAVFLAASLAENFLQDQAPLLATRALLMFKMAAGMEPRLSEQETEAIAAYGRVVDMAIAKRNEMLFGKH